MHLWLVNMYECCCAEYFWVLMRLDCASTFSSRSAAGKSFLHSLSWFRLVFNSFRFVWFRLVSFHFFSVSVVWCRLTPFHFVWLVPFHFVSDGAVSVHFVSFGSVSFHSVSIGSVSFQLVPFHFVSVGAVSLCFPFPSWPGLGARAEPTAGGSNPSRGHGSREDGVRHLPSARRGGFGGTRGAAGVRLAESLPG